MEAWIHGLVLLTLRVSPDMLSGASGRRAGFWGDDSPFAFLLTYCQEPKGDALGLGVILTLRVSPDVASGASGRQAGFGGDALQKLGRLPVTFQVDLAR